MLKFIFIANKMFRYWSPPPTKFVQLLVNLFVKDERINHACERGEISQRNEIAALQYFIKQIGRAFFKKWRKLFGSFKMLFSFLLLFIREIRGSSGECARNAWGTCECSARGLELKEFLAETIFSLIFLRRKKPSQHIRFWSSYWLAVRNYKQYLFELFWRFWSIMVIKPF